MKTKIDKELRKSVSVTKNGKPTKMTKGDVIAAKLVDSSMQGNVQTTTIVIRLNEDVSAAMVAPNETAEIRMPDKDALKRISARLLRRAEDAD